VPPTTKVTAPSSRSTVNRVPSGKAPSTSQHYWMSA
jgi:hypothetical protein